MSGNISSTTTETQDTFTFQSECVRTIISKGQSSKLAYESLPETYGSIDLIKLSYRDRADRKQANDPYALKEIRHGKIKEAFDKGELPDCYHDWSELEPLLRFRKKTDAKVDRETVKKTAERERENYKGDPHYKPSVDQAATRIRKEIRSAISLGIQLGLPIEDLKVLRTNLMQCTREERTSTLLALYGQVRRTGGDVIADSLGPELTEKRDKVWSDPQLTDPSALTLDEDGVHERQPTEKYRLVVHMLHGTSHLDASSEDIADPDTRRVKVDPKTRKINDKALLERRAISCSGVSETIGTEWGQVGFSIKPPDPQRVLASQRSDYASKMQFRPELAMENELRGKASMLSFDELMEKTTLKWNEILLRGNTETETDSNRGVPLKGKDIEYNAVVYYEGPDRETNARQREWALQVAKENNLPMLDLGVKPIFYQIVNGDEGDQTLAERCDAYDPRFSEDPFGGFGPVLSFNTAEALWNAMNSSSPSDLERGVADLMRTEQSVINKFGTPRAGTSSLQQLRESMKDETIEDMLKMMYRRDEFRDWHQGKLQNFDAFWSEDGTIDLAKLPRNFSFQFNGLHLIRLASARHEALTGTALVQE